MRKLDRGVAGRLALVETQEPAGALPACDRSGPRVIRWRLNEPPIEALVVALGMVVGDAFLDGPSLACTADQDAPAQPVMFRKSNFRTIHR